MNRSLAATCLAALVTVLPASAQSEAPQKIDPAKEGEIRHLLEVTGARTQAVRMMALITQQMKKAIEPLIKDDRSRQAFEAFSKRLEAEANPDELLTQVVPIYDRHLTREDIQALVQFYESAVGQRYIKALPEITQESFAAGQQWAARIVQKVRPELEKEFPELKPKPPQTDKP